VNTIAAVVVTFNRLALLQECIAALRGQARRPDDIIVIDNSSTDGTADWLAAQKDLTVIRQANLGSSGGQYAGIKAGYLKGHDWLWCMDDDTIPDPDALERMTATPYFRPQTGFLCSTLLWSDRRPHPLHAFHPTRAAEWAGTVLEDRCIRVSMHTFVSVLVSRAAVAAVGLPVKEFFLIVDDYEYTDRISQRFPCYCVLDSRVVHKTRYSDKPPDLWGADLLKECYRARNEVAWTLRRRNMGRWGKLQYIATLWVYYGRMVLMRTAHPRVLWWLLRGLVFRYRVETV
jgi:rhamnopyranosyl-N-acetylglucosaminyl-diphospho-decaprenol beta-1,3/1,4-galactofuranosyltransferase